MRRYGWQLNIIIASALLTLALLLGGQWIYRQQYQEKPLASNIKELQGVEGVTTGNRDGQVDIQMALGRVPDLQETYLEARKAAAATYGPDGFYLEVKGREGPEVDKAWYKVQYAVYEAARQGNFTDMAKTVEQEARLDGLDSWGLYVDDQNIYLQMHLGGQNLYRVVTVAAGSLQGAGAGAKGGSA